MSVAMKTTTVPQWATRAWGAATDARHCVVIDFDDDDSSCRPGYDVYRCRHFDEVQQQRLSYAANQWVVGTRLYLHGPEVEVSAAWRWAHTLGFEDCEISAEVTDGSGFNDIADRAVFCADCHATDRLDCKVGDTVHCKNCGTPLEVYYHFSRRHGGYLGFRADAEEVR